ncbi:MFS transporter [Paenibacillus sp. A3]|uniref:MFS transporter n=1 Tax=Paenibacillus sp. A3 TaxID=1337054 RepID=UPI0023571779|nr:MFS transporter [Paenibacillus sp. A3]
MYPEEQRANASAKAFIGTSMGMVLGVPLTTYIADQFSYEASFLFCAIVNGIAAAGIAVILPKTSAAPRVKYREQLSILRIWLSIGAATFLFAAMFAVYSYSAEFLGQVMGLQERILSIMLVVFGVGGVAGNLLAGKLLGMNRLRTTLVQPFVLAIAYFLLDSGVTSLVLVTAVMLLWGAAHTSGLIVTQTLLTSEASEAPEFVNALYISFINLGVSIGSAVGGRFIAAAGIEGSLKGGILFIALTLVSMVFNIWVKRRV